MKHDKPLALPIKKIITESERVKTFVFDYDFPGEPGQFVMCWIPGFDEKPFGIIKKDGFGFMISVAAVGESTKALHMMEVGDMLGFRGPYGSTFNLPDFGSIALVAGGYGMVPLSFLAQEARKKDIDVHLFIGARTKEELLFKSWMEEIGVIIHPSTDDGSEGFKGFNVQVFEDFVTKHPPSFGHPHVERALRLPEGGPIKDLPFEGSTPQGGGMLSKAYTVGPEIMEMKVAEICYANNIPFEVSLERYMKCGFGICGQCCVDPVGWRMCVEGPVIDGEKLKQISEFGKYHRTASGKVEKYPWNKDK
ncbi:MAG: dihydroorotate dehydrogenase electron transfer subunit [bacterium]|nr:dihydroorotate dehydrogenase electron transfer subunit [bacterium]